MEPSNVQHWLWLQSEGGGEGGERKGMLDSHPQEEKANSSKAFNELSSPTTGQITRVSTTLGSIRFSSQYPWGRHCSDERPTQKMGASRSIRFWIRFQNLAVLPQTGWATVYSLKPGRKGKWYLGICVPALLSFRRFTTEVEQTFPRFTLLMGKGRRGGYQRKYGVTYRIQKIK